MTDWELLQEYVRRRSDDAFAEIVRRHVGWVASAARRQVRDEQMAEDVTQAVFVALAQRASRLHRGTAVSTWLFQVTRYAAIHVLRSEARRRHHERKRAAMVHESASCLNQEQWDEISPVLDELVGRLREKDRLAVILRFYEGKALADVGKELAVSEEAARKRVDRAVEKLRGMLKSKGLGGTSAAALAGGLGTYVTEPASASQVSHVMCTALAAHGAGNAGHIAGIAQGALKMIAYAKAKVIGAIAVAGLLAITSAGVVSSNTGSEVTSQVADAHPSTAPVEAASGVRPMITDKAGRECMRRMRDVGSAVIEYANRHQDRLPADLGATLGYVKRLVDGSEPQPRPVIVEANQDAERYMCPEGRGLADLPQQTTAEWVNRYTSFEYLGSSDVDLTKIPRVPGADRVVMLYDKDQRGHANIGGRIPVVFFDGHAEAMELNELTQAIADSKKALDQARAEQKDTSE